jgi:hypothetical protein
MQEEQEITKIELLVLYVLWGASVLVLMGAGYVACLRR